jgi:hypothetical protein
MYVRKVLVGGYESTRFSLQMYVHSRAGQSFVLMCGEMNFIWTVVCLLGLWVSIEHFTAHKISALVCPVTVQNVAVKWREWMYYLSRNRQPFVVIATFHIYSVCVCVVCVCVFVCVCVCVCVCVDVCVCFCYTHFFFSALSAYFILWQVSGNRFALENEWGSVVSQTKEHPSYKNVYSWELCTFVLKN